MDGALRMLVDVEGLPALAAALLDSGMGERTVAAVMGGNAINLLSAGLPGDSG
jgi:microsomal dipeptidase-like Zn-dependent dipeptidase